MKKLIIFTCLLALAGCKSAIHQTADITYQPKISAPTYASGEGPVVMVDEGHFNFHTARGRYRPFAELLKADGYQIRLHKGRFTQDSLAGGDVLVIANALSKRNSKNLSLPVDSAFDEREIQTVVDWVHNGGALLLIADHMPMPKAAEKLADKFGALFNNGFAVENANTGVSKPIVFTICTGSLAKHPEVTGQSDRGDVCNVATFTGQAFQVDKNWTSLLTFSTGAASLMPTVGWDFNDQTPRVSVEGWSQGAIRDWGLGRIATFGEAAMFTAQISNDIKVGMQLPCADGNELFLLNIMQWLLGESGDEKNNNDT